MASTSKKIKLHNFEEISTALKRRVSTWRHENVDGANKDVKNYMESIKLDGINLIKSALGQHRCLKVNLASYVTLDNLEREREYGLNLKNVEIYRETNLDEFWEGEVDKLAARLEAVEIEGSGFSLKQINSLQININKYCPLKASSYLDLPEFIKNKQAVINIKNEDNQCFKWAILSALYPAKTKQNKVSSYRNYENEIKMGTIAYPVKICDIPRFEKLNNISVNVFTFEYSEGTRFVKREIHYRFGRHAHYRRYYKNKVAKFVQKLKVFPLYNNKVRYEKEVDLLYYTKDTTSHYCWIKNLSALLASQLNYKCFANICRRCLYFTLRHEAFIRHKEICNDRETATYKLSPGPVKFRSSTKKLRIPYTIYCDSESFLNHVDKHSGNTTKYQLHTMNSFAFYVHSIYDNIKQPFYLYRGENAATKFIDALEEYAKEIYSYMQVDKPMDVLTSEEQEQFSMATVCYICSEPFRVDKVHDHDHYTGKYRGPACNTCNINYKVPNFIPVFFHNLTSYDCHMFIKTMPGIEKCIARTEEKYISFSKKVRIVHNDTYLGNISLRFLDSLNFMNSSLDKLSSSLSKDQFKIVLKIIGSIPRKGIYPYDYIDCFEKFNETSLPTREKFYNKLNDTHISEEDYQRAVDDWNKNGDKNIGEYHDRYLKGDVLLLADVFENFRDSCLQAYGLDPCHYYTTPGLSWDCMLLKTKVKLDLPQDYDVILFLEQAKRGGISQCSGRKGEANHALMKNYDKTKPTTTLAYWDANNLYGWALSQPLPIGGFEWIDEWDLSELNDYIDPPEGIGYFLEVDLAYPPGELHDWHNDYPLAPEHKCPPKGKIPKLLCHLNDREKYVIHYSTLKCYLDLGMKLEKIHRILKFNQEPFIKQYIDLNTNFRSLATSDFEKDFFKLMNNSIFGKSIQNVRHMQNIKIVSSWKQAQRLINSDNFKSVTIFSENLVAIHSYKKIIKFDKPIYIGVAVLDLSKTFMYNFHYNVMKPYFKEDLKVLYTDTDSFIYEIKHHDVPKFIKEHPQYFDTSNYPEDHKLYSSKNKQIIGMFKDELKGGHMIRYIGLRAKLYAFEDEDNKVSKKCKGLKTSVLNKTITFEDYEKCLAEQIELKRKQNTFRSYKHDVYSITTEKVAMSWNDDKRHLIPGSTDTLAHGHYKLRTLDNSCS